MATGPKTEKAVDQVDASCVRQIQAGRSDLIELLVRKHSDRLYHIILQMVQSPAAAEDLLQDTWVRVIRNLHTFDPDYPLTPWLTQIAVNACRSFWRRERLRGLLGLRKISSWQSEPESDVHRELEAKKLAQAALKSLSPLLREIVVLKFYSGLTYEEIAGALKIPAGTAKSRLNYALMKMRNHMGQEKT
jgi:RNA polymerase sigma-70 factor (ECF subfamily)